MSKNNSRKYGSNTDKVKNGRNVQRGDAVNDNDVNQHEQRQLKNIEIDSNKQSSVRDDSLECDKMCDNCHCHQIKTSECHDLSIDPDWLTFKTYFFFNKYQCSNQV